MQPSAIAGMSPVCERSSVPSKRNCGKGRGSPRGFQKLWLEQPGQRGGSREAKLLGFCSAHSRGVGTETALIGKGVGGKGTGRIAGLEWARPGEEAQRSQRPREPVLRAPISTVTGGNIGVMKLREESTDSFLFCIL